MAKPRVLLDTNALIKRYYPPEDKYHFIKTLFQNQSIVKVVPNVCIVEVFRVMHRYLKWRQITKEERDLWRKTIQEDIENHRILLHRVTKSEILLTDEITEIAEALPPRPVTLPDGRQRYLPALSGIDLLVIGVAIDLKTEYTDVYLCTSDVYMKAVARKCSIPVLDPLIRTHYKALLQIP